MNGFKTLFALMAVSASALADNPPPSYGAPAPAPTYGSPAPPAYGAPAPASYAPAPAPTYHVPERNCTVEFEKAETEICVPTLQTECKEEEVTLKAPVEQEKCLEITTTECKAEVTTETVEICVYIYEKEEKEAEAKVADVKYTKRCDTSYVSVCKPAKPHYGSSSYEEPKEDCKEVPQETCYNKPQAESKDKTVKVAIPKPVKKCESKKIQIPTVTCENKKEERCFNLVTLEETTQQIQKCITSIAEPKCNKVSLTLPAQTCVEELKEASYGSPPPYTA